MVNRRNYYRILQVQPDAPAEVIRTSYRTLMRDLKNHPDLGGDHRTASLMNEAYAVLSNSRSRAEYDRKLFHDFRKQVLSETGSGEPRVFSAMHPFHRKSGVNTASPRSSCATGGESQPGERTGGCQRGNDRTVHRVKKEGALRYYLPGDKKRSRAAILDLSPKGVRFISERYVRPDTMLILQCPLFYASAVVASIKEIVTGEEASYSIGARFLSVTFMSERGSFYSCAV
jgi:curved DNA-binding protein CbpA